MATDVVDRSKERNERVWRFVGYFLLVALGLLIVWYAIAIVVAIWMFTTWLFSAIWFHTLGVPFAWLSRETGASPFSPGFLTTCFFVYVFFDTWRITELQIDEIEMKVKKVLTVYGLLLVCGLFLRLA
jgi:hypothetical protein